MKALLRPAVLLAAVGLSLCTTGQAATAADLFAPGPRAGSPYDDPRYDYLYGRDDAPPPPGWSRRSPPPRYDDERPLPPTYRRAPPSWRTGYCTSRRVVKRRLAAGGWSNFERAEIVDRDYVGVDAKHADGGVYRLTIDRCTGNVVDARLIRGAPLYARPDTDRYDDWRGRRDAWPVRPYAWRWRRDRWRDDWD
jgi:hypothetical protein